jgi:diketogulonate reductase-like aldo/keto reductase
MKKLPIKGTNMAFSTLGLGTGTGFKKDSCKSQKEFFDVFDASIDSGINWIDTAESYANSYAESLIGKYSKASSHNFYVASKFSPINATNKKLRQACESSLKRLNRECIDLYQIHWMNYDIPISETMETLASLRKEGKIRAIGVCNFSDTEILNCNDDFIASNQIEFNLFNRIAEEGLLSFHKQRDLISIAYSPFDGIKGLLPESEKKKILSTLMTKYSATSFQIALSFLASYQNMLITFSSTNSNHIIENTNLLDINKKDLKLISQIFLSSVKLIDPKSIKILSTKSNKFYENLYEAEINKYDYFPGVEELSKEFLMSNNFKPIKVKKIEDKHFEFELTGGMMRYWSWIKANSDQKPILAAVTNE